MMGGDVDCSSKGVMGITVSERSSSLLIVVIYPLFYSYLQNSQAADLGNKRFGDLTKVAKMCMLFQIKT